MVRQPSERRTRAEAELREKILSAARLLFARRGYEAVTMREIARKIGSTATVQLRGGKDDYDGDESPIPAALLAGKDKVTVRFQAKPGKAAGPVYDVRVVTVQ